VGLPTFNLLSEGARKVSQRDDLEAALYLDFERLFARTEYLKAWYQARRVALGLPPRQPARPPDPMSHAEYNRLYYYVTKGRAANVAQARLLYPRRTPKAEAANETAGAA
jgi:hypothetical protein